MTTTVTTVLNDPRFKAAEAALQQGYTRFVDELITLTEIPAPPFKEQRRAAAYLKMMIDAGLDDAFIDDIGNVCGVLRGGHNAGHVAVAAHLDTVFPEGTDVTVRREGTRLFAPGVGDDTRGLATNLNMIRALIAAGIRPARSILFVGDVGEEGKGDLRGIRHLFEQGPFKGQIEAFVGVDGDQTARIVNQAVGSLRYRVTFRGPGGHSFGAFGVVNPAYAMAAVLTGLSQLHLPTEPKTTATPSVFGGGTSVNATPEAVWFELDLRSVSATELTRIDREFRALLDQAVAAENARGQTHAGVISVELQNIGNRPAGLCDPASDIVAASLEAARAYGFDAELRASSTDANIPISLGVPAVCMGHGADDNTRAHSLEENIDVAEDKVMRSQAAILATILAVAGIAE
ncbi:M20/M25/M40 family metallo-hydrolase [Ketogulonicigenium vulgare]|uniref:M20/M25/M40 family metallo-hydrolase n=1 Tax=Ketogulonicigenium vulgare TaxID=92945 RepID=UPI002359624F|nr:M20/M25/M40 family metallo-hydrolase [Ketogulonicigenium vulgare]